MTSSAQLEQEAEQTRAQLARTLDELRERITPGQLVDQAVDYAKDSGGGTFVRNLGSQMTGNPLPVAFIGAGLAWLMLSSGRRSVPSSRAKEGAIDRARRAAIDTAARMTDAGQAASARMSEWTSEAAAGLSEAGRQAGERTRAMADTAQTAASQSAQDRSAHASQAAGSAAQRASSTYESAKSSASESYGRFADTASRATSEAYGQFSDAASDTYDRVSDTTARATSTVSQSLSSFGQTTAAASRNMLQFCKSQPLVLAGIGMALGAILGALIPPTEAEDRLMGETSDEMKDQARNAAGDQIERAKSATESALKETEAKLHEESAADSGLPAETSLVPETDHGAEHRGSSEAAEHDR
jgi:ElaB/YqjD/DUF883 family membrane-anchored ribosome-binding protein